MHRDRLRPLVPLAFGIALLVWACDDGTAPEEPTVATVEVTPATDSLTAIGASIQFSAVARTRDGQVLQDAAFSWTSDQPAVATVRDSTGEAMAVGNGSATITATADGVSGSATLHVAQQAAALVVTAEPAGAPAGQALAAQPVLEIRDANGNRVTNDDATIVTAAIADDDAAVEAGATATAEGGVVAFTGLVVGGVAGSHTLDFSADGLPGASSAAFSIDPGPPAAIARAAGDGQTGLAATRLADSLAVEVVDAYGNAVPDAAVTWSSSGEGAVAAATSVTDTHGIARNSYTLGDHAGVDTVRAAVAGAEGSPVLFVATATPNATIAGTITLPPAEAAGAPAGARPGAGSPWAGAAARGPSRAAAGVHPPDVAWRSAAGSDLPVGTTPDHRPRHTPDELIVTFERAAVGAPRADAAPGIHAAEAEHVSAAIRRRLDAGAGTGLVTTTGVSPVLATARVRVEPSRLDEAAARLRAMPGVKSVSRNGFYYADEAPAPRRGPAPAAAGFPANDPYYAYQAWHYGMIHLPEAWNVTTGAASVLVAVLDDGIRFDHPAIAPNLTDDGYDFVANTYIATFCTGWTGGHALDGDGPDPDPTVPGSYVWDDGAECWRGRELGGHGLHVAGTIGAVGNDALGMTGVNWNVRIRPIRVLGAAGGPDYDVAQGVLYAAGLPADGGSAGTVQAGTRADIINMSLGGPAISDVLRDAIAAAADAGSLIVTSAGNAASPDPHYPSGLPETLSVSAVGPDRELASYSSWGTTVDIAAPGGDYEDGGSGFMVWSTLWDFSRDRPTYASSQGTSMATPHVAGVAALLLARDPSLTADQLRARLLDFAVDLGEPGRDDYFGAGLLDARNSLTRTMAPAADLYARLYDAGTGRPIGQVPAGPGGTFEFHELPDGQYFVFAGRDRGGDAMIGVPGRRWGAYGEATDPSPIAVDGAGTYGAIDFDVGYPREVEPNPGPATATFLPLGGWLRGDLYQDADPADHYRVVIPVEGTYTFETSAMEGACGFALEEDTYLRLFDASGVVLAERDDIDSAGYDWCSRITTTLTPGTYDLEVTGYNGGRYHIHARSGG